MVMLNDIAQPVNAFSRDGIFQSITCARPNGSSGFSGV